MLTIVQPQDRSTSSASNGARSVPRTIRALVIGGATVIASFGLPEAAQADTCRWVGAGVDARWSRPANWTTRHSGGVPQHGDLVVFESNAPSISENDIAGLVLDGLLFSGEGAGNVPYELSGQPIGVTTAITFNSATYGARVSTPLILDGPRVVVQNLGPRPAPSLRPSLATAPWPSTRTRAIS